jgi:hypothetical protein
MIRVVPRKILTSPSTAAKEEQRLAPAPQVHSDDDEEDQPNSDHGVGLSGEGQPVRDRVPRRAAMGGEESID